MEGKELEKKIEPIFAKHEAVILAYLFGSAARGNTHSRSDLDLAVLMRDLSLEAYRALWADLHDGLSPLAFDLVTLNDADPVLSFDVVREGRPLFYRSAEDLNDFELRAWHRYQDTRHLRAIGNQYLLGRAKEWFSNRSPSSSASSDSKK
jgi:hypothetical protein